MPKRTDLQKILLIGSGPIVIGQACEFDYSGTQALKALKEEGYELVLINSNPATIMTDPGLADRTYIEPIDPQTVARIIEKERPDALLPTLGGQTGLNTALAVAEMGVLDACGVELIGASRAAIEKAESRDLFRQAMESIGLTVPPSHICHSLDEVRTAAAALSFPVIVRPAYTLGGTGGGVAYNLEELEKIAGQGIAASRADEVMLEKSILGWKEYELEVMRDAKDNCVIICSIENVDPMGVHTGDSITVAPAQTLSDREYQKMRNASLAIMREIGVETGGSNVQFAVNPEDGEMVVIEMNPRVSRSSALASKATGFPIAKIAAKLAVGYTLDEIPNDITRETMASFEPVIDYVVTKIPRLTFEKFPGTQDMLTTSMKSVGEVMSIGRTFKESLQKGLRGLEVGMPGLGTGKTEKCPADQTDQTKQEILAKLRIPNSRRIFFIHQALCCGMSVEEVCEASRIDPWFIGRIQELVQMEESLRTFGLYSTLNAANKELRPLLERAKQYGFSDKQIAGLWNRLESDIKALRQELDIEPVYYLVDTCAAEFEAYTPYFYSTYETGAMVAMVATDETGHKVPQTDEKKVIILGGGPNRIGQGIEFDYCCVHASYALKDMGITSIMVNSNPETVSTDYDTSDRLYFEPLTFEDVVHIVEKEKPLGVIVQFGGQTPLNLAVPLLRAGVPVLGTSPDAIDRAEDRRRFQALLEKLELKQPANGTALSVDEALTVAQEVGYPVVVRPSYVLGGRAMAVVYDEAELRVYFDKEVVTTPEHPLLIDKFLENATELDVDALSDGKDVYVAGIMEHIEEAGIHSGDSACVLPPHTLAPEMCAEIERQTIAMAKELEVVGLMNVQFAIKDACLYILEVNPRASRTAPFVSKATGVPLPRLALQVIMGKPLAELDPWSMRQSGHVAVKESVFPFNKFPDVDVILGPEMRSTGEVMGIAESFGMAVFKAQSGVGQTLPGSGTVFLSVNERDKAGGLEIARLFAELGFDILATRGTGAVLQENKVPVTIVNKIHEGQPHVGDYIKNGQVDLLINTASGQLTQSDSSIIRQTALLYDIPYTTTLAGARAWAQALACIARQTPEVKSLQEYFQGGTLS